MAVEIWSNERVNVPTIDLSSSPQSPLGVVEPKNIEGIRNSICLFIIVENNYVEMEDKLIFKIVVEFDLWEDLQVELNII